MQILEHLFNVEIVKIAYLVSILAVSSTVLGLTMILAPRLFLRKAKRHQKISVKKVRYVGSAFVSPFLLLAALLKNAISRGEPPTGL